MPTTTLLYASLLGILAVFLGVRVSLRRRVHHVSLGDGGDPELRTRIRALGNLVEYVPFALLVMALVELSGGRSAILHGIGSLLVLGRIGHAAGMPAGPMSNAQRFGRQFGAAATWLVLLGTSLYGLLLTLQAHW